VAGWPDHACRGCSFHGDQVSHLAHLNARDTTLVWASRASQADIARLKARPHAGVTDEVAEAAAAFLASDRASGMTRIVANLTGVVD
jgi:predicted dithiol-disulfide oxidoreductase (DUF899 family)